MQFFLTPLIVITFATMLTACGGGGSNAVSGDPNDVSMNQAPDAVQQFAALFKTLKEPYRATVATSRRLPLAL